MIFSYAGKKGFGFIFTVWHVMLIKGVTSKYMHKYVTYNKSHPKS